MSLIPYPNVPNLPGVPALARSNNAQFAAAALTIVGELLPNNLFGPQWSILNQKTGQKALEPDSFVAIEYRNERKIPTYPLEQGSFQSYNKVALPYDLKVTVSCGGNQTMSTTQFLDAIATMLNSLDVITVVTPNRTYLKTSLIHVDYRRESTRGATLILAQLWFQELRISTQPITPTITPSGTQKTPLGQLSPVNPTGTFGSINPNATAGGFGIK
jgi:hypothetical protein